MTKNALIFFFKKKMFFFFFDFNFWNVLMLSNLNFSSFFSFDYLFRSTRPDEKVQLRRRIEAMGADTENSSPPAAPTTTAATTTTNSSSSSNKDNKDNASEGSQGSKHKMCERVRFDFFLLLSLSIKVSLLIKKQNNYSVDKLVRKLVLRLGIFFVSIGFLLFF